MNADELKAEQAKVSPKDVEILTGELIDMHGAEAYRAATRYTVRATMDNLAKDAAIWGAVGLELMKRGYHKK